MIGIKELPYTLRSYTYKHNKMAPESLFPELEEKLNTHIPFVAGKIGGFELWALRANEFGYKKEYREVYDKLCNNAGFFSDKDDIEANLKAYTDRMKDTLSEVDYLIRWQYSKDEYFVRKYCKSDIKDIEWLGVIYYETPIGPLLKGRKVLAITPFAESAKSQYARRELVYPEKYLPEFDLQTYKSVQTIAGNRDPRFNNWFEALDGMIEDVCKMDFDIALVGCGAYGLPLCSAIKRAGKSAIHMGGDLQLLFGIMGKRWEDHWFFKNIKNEYWVYPDKSEIPSNSETVEDGCYW